jgi:hypothetical protein
MGSVGWLAHLRDRADTGATHGCGLHGELPARQFTLFPLSARCLGEGAHDPLRRGGQARIQGGETARNDIGLRELECSSQRAEQAIVVFRDTRADLMTHLHPLLAMRASRRTTTAWAGGPHVVKLTGIDELRQLALFSLSARSIGT